MPREAYCGRTYCATLQRFGCPVLVSRFLRDRAGILTFTDDRYNPDPFSFRRSPLGLDLHKSINTDRVVNEAAPLPIFGTRNQISSHRIPMDVPQLLNSLRFSPNIEVVITRLPERTALRQT